MSVVVASPALRDKLSKILGMLGSDHAGERASAGAAADKLVRDAGLSWPDVIGTGAPVGGLVDYRIWREPRSDRESAAIALKFSEVLSDWEIGFCEKIIKLSRVSAKQRTILDRLVAKAREFSGVEVAA